MTLIKQPFGKPNRSSKTNCQICNLCKTIKQASTGAYDARVWSRCEADNQRGEREKQPSPIVSQVVE